ncbi:MAG: DUF998 domain-containing protein, partial [Promethearchaeota archaeon]
GKSSPKNHRNYMLVVVGAFLVVSVWAQIQFPEPYSILRNTISDQGGIILNPDGYKLWNFAIILLGIFTIPYFLFLYNILRSLSEIASVLSTGLGIISSLSVSFVGIYPLDLQAPHAISAGIAFIGIFLKANIDLVLLLLKNRSQPQSKKTINIIKIGIFYTLLDGAFIMMMTTFLINGSIVPFWEWLYFLSVVLWIFGMGRISH